jgi:hypothetical protein
MIVAIYFLQLKANTYAVLTGIMRRGVWTDAGF